MSGFWEWASEHWVITGICFVLIADGFNDLCIGLKERWRK